MGYASGYATLKEIKARVSARYASFLHPCVINHCLYPRIGSTVYCRWHIAGVPIAILQEAREEAILR